jgi:hypothetical protein
VNYKIQGVNWLGKHYIIKINNKKSRIYTNCISLVADCARRRDKLRELLERVSFNKDDMKEVPIYEKNNSYDLEEESRRPSF